MQENLEFSVGSMVPALNVQEYFRQTDLYATPIIEWLKRSYIYLSMKVYEFFRHKQIIHEVWQEKIHLFAMLLVMRVTGLYLAGGAS